jgi:hypothetical protein
MTQRVYKKTIKEYRSTWRARRAISVTEYIIVNQKLAWCVEHMRLYGRANIYLDHFLVWANVAIQLKCQKAKFNERKELMAYKF